MNLDGNVTEFVSSKKRKRKEEKKNEIEGVRDLVLKQSDYKYKYFLE